jgi:peptidoglycan/LPS O-acetylase OafA/YrhL
LDSNPEFLFLPASFAVGVLLAINRDTFKVDIKPAIGFSILAYLLWDTRFAEFAFCCAAFFSVLYISALPLFIKFKPKSDISYGIYLWGFLVQQSIQFLYPSPNIYVKMFASLAISILLGILSWHLIEKRAMSLGKKLSVWISGTDKRPQPIITKEDSVVNKELLTVEEPEHVNTGN